METAADNDQELLYVKIASGDDEVFRGYKTDFLTKSLSSLEEEFLICQICNGLMRDAVLTCGDTMCLFCCEDVNNYNSVNKVNKAIEVLAVRCPAMRKCGWVGTLNEAISHIEICPDFKMTCVNCDFAIERSEMLQHILKKCPNRLVLCEYCEHKVFAMSINEHINNCQHAPELCPNDCGIEIKRTELQKHITYNCENRFVSCEFFKFGCTEKLIQVKAMSSHNKDMMLRHQDLMLEQIKQIQQQNENMKSQISENFRLQNELRKISLKLDLELKSMQQMEGVDWVIDQLSQETEIKGPKFFIGGYKLRCFAVFTEDKPEIGRRNFYCYFDQYNVRVYLKRKRREKEKRLGPVALTKCTAILIDDDDKTNSTVQENPIYFQLKTDLKSETMADLWFKNLSQVDGKKFVHLTLYFNTGSQMLSQLPTCVESLQNTEIQKSSFPKEKTNVSGLRNLNQKIRRTFSDKLWTHQQPNHIPISYSVSTNHILPNRDDDVYVTMQSIQQTEDADTADV